jgi:hypothetical protein
MRTFVLTIAIVVCAFAVPARAQSHPCDAPNATAITITGGAPMKVVFCAKQVDQVDGAILYVNGAPTTLATLTQTTATANVAGLVQYAAAIGSFAKGSYTIEVSVLNHDIQGGAVQESARSSPLALSVVSPLPVPTAPQLKTITKS